MPKRRDWGTQGVKKENFENDTRSTPKWTVRLLLRNYEFKGDVWDPACGIGNIPTVLKEEGYRVTATDLYETSFGTAGENFLLANKTLAKNIISHPPNKILTEFMQKAMELEWEACAFLCRLSVLESRERYQIFKEFPPVKVIAIADRVDFYEEKPGGQFIACWIVWEKGFKGNTQLVWDTFYAPDPDQLTISDI